MLNRVTAVLKLMAISFLWIVVTAQAGDPRTVVLGMGGGSLKDAVFSNTGNNYGDATFSFFASIDKRGGFKGSVFFKRLYRGNLNKDGGVRAVVSTEITVMEWGYDNCPWVRMEGLATHHANWHKVKNGFPPGPMRDHNFAIQVWDCDSVGEGPDKIWFQLRRPDSQGGTQRGAVTLIGPTQLTGGNITVLDEGFPP